MRLDKFFTAVNIASRSEACRAVRQGRVTVNGVPVRRPELHIDPDSDIIALDGKKIAYRHFTYIMLNKPSGYISATEDGNLPCVLELIPPELRRGIFPCGRLDRDTVGLMLLTDDGELAHFLLSPVSHVNKIYFFRCASPLTDDAVGQLESGVDIGEDKLTKPSCLTLESDRKSGTITLREGRYHQIKRMLEAVDNKITFLKRIAFGELVLDNTLAPGEWRFLTDSEAEQLQAHNRNKRNTSSNP